MTRCIHCTRCVRFTNEIAEVKAPTGHKSITFPDNSELKISGV